MDKVTKYLDKLPIGSRDMSIQIWQSFPSDLRDELNKNLSTFYQLAQGNPMALADVAEILKRQLGPAFSPLSKIAIVGPVNVGKSTLFNSILSGTGQTAEVSPVPGTTVEAQEATAGAFSLIDTPGLDNAQKSGEQEFNVAYDQAKMADFLLIVFDATRGVTSSDFQLYQQLLQLKKTYLVVLNKIDLIAPKQRTRVIESAARALGLDVSNIHQISATRKEGIGQLILDIAAAEPRLLGELGRTITPIRRRLSWQSIRRSAVGSCAVALSPIPIIDLIPLTIIQASMVLTIAKIYDQPMTFSRAKELLAAFGAGVAARNLFAQLSKIGGMPGWIISSLVATTGTIVIGYSSMLWFEMGIKPSQKLLKDLSNFVTNILMEATKKLKNIKKLNRKEVKEVVNEAVNNATQKLDERLVQEQLQKTQEQNKREENK